MPIESGTGVKVDMKEAIRVLGGLEAIAGMSKDRIEAKEIMRMGARMMNADIESAFRQHVNPSTGRAWPARRHDYPWEMLNRTGTLRAMIDAGWGLDTRDEMPSFYGRVREGYYLGGFKSTSRAHKPTMLVAGAVQWGRKWARSVKETKQRGTVAQTGQTPPRPFWGFSRSSRNKLKAEILRALKKHAGAN